MSSLKPVFLSLSPPGSPHVSSLLCCTRSWHVAAEPLVSAAARSRAALSAPPGLLPCSLQPPPAPQSLPSLHRGPSGAPQYFESLSTFPTSGPPLASAAQYRSKLPWTFQWFSPVWKVKMNFSDVSFVSQSVPVTVISGRHPCRGCGTFMSLITVSLLRRRVSCAPSQRSADWPQQPAGPTAPLCGLLRDCRRLGSAAPVRCSLPGS